MKCRAQFLLSQNTQHAALSEISREEAMHIPKDAMLLRIFIGENDRFEQQSLSEAIVRPFQPPAHRQDYAPFI
jgi:hypothetical protein